VGCGAAAAEDSTAPRLPRRRSDARESPRWGMRLYGRGEPGPNFYVDVAVRVRLCGRRGRAVFRITETSSPPGRNSPVFARGRRERRRAQERRCQTHRFSWNLAERFFGASRYRVAVRARTSRTGWSRVAVRHVDTYD
jgi:hypothetical protein